MEEFNLNGRFFAFGCSFTINNSRPTWADIVGNQFAEYQNWARGGSGNHYIFNSLVEAHQRNKFTSNDTVMIMWTSITREDRYVERLGGWIGNGNIYWQNVYDKDFVKEYACERGYLIRDLAFISAAKQLLDTWGVNYRMMSMIPIDSLEHISDKYLQYHDVTVVYKDVLDCILPSVYEVVFNNQHWQLKSSDFGAWINEASLIRDPHPDPKEALQYVTSIFPNLPIKQSTVDWINTFKYGTDIPFMGPERL